MSEINKQGKKNDRVINCLLQFHIAQEETKFGLSFEEAQDLLTSDEFIRMENISIVGVMGMATFTSDETILDEEFSSLKAFFEQNQPQHPNLKILSMGMSGDYKIGIRNGSTMIRVGSSIFGARNYIA